MKERELQNRQAFQAEPARAGIPPVVALDASRNRSGGAKAHLLGILGAIDPRDHGIAHVHVWSYLKLLESIPDAPWLIKHAPPALERSLAHQLWWQYRQLPKEIRKHGCDILLSTDAGSVCRFSPAVVMSRDMLSFEAGEMKRFGLSMMWVRLLLLRFMQVGSLQRAAGALFLTQYASEVIQRFTGRLRRVRIIPHGISEQFRMSTRRSWVDSDTAVNCLYVSNADLYKHQWHVVRAIARLRRTGHRVRLTLIGGGSGAAETLLNDSVAEEDPFGDFVTRLDSVPHHEIPSHLAKADIFVFASSCENMPNTLVEAMASGLPIACSNRGPMPEILMDSGAFFDPESPQSIADAIAKLLSDKNLRNDFAAKSKALSNQYSWSRCARETWRFLADVSAASSADTTKCR